MSFSTSIVTFLSVAFVYVAFTFAWGWYKGRQADREANESTTAPSGGEN